MALGAKLATSDRAPHFQYREGREAQWTGEFGGPCRCLQRHRRVVAGERRQVGVATAQVNPTQVENEFGSHGSESPMTLTLWSIWIRSRVNALGSALASQLHAVEARA